MIRRIPVFALAALATLFLVAPAMARGSGSDPAKSIVQIARENGSFTTLLKAVEVAGLTGTLSGQGKGPLTVFAPTDAAFAKLDPAALQSLLADRATLRNVLLYHVAAGDLRAADVVSRSSLSMLNGGTAAIHGATINGANIVITDIVARNGVIHVIDAVLLPN